VASALMGPNVTTPVTTPPTVVSRPATHGDLQGPARPAQRIVGQSPGYFLDATDSIEVGYKPEKTPMCGAWSACTLP